VKPWLRNLLIVVLALVVLGGVAAVSFGLGLRAAAHPAAFATFGGGDGEEGGRIVVQQGGEEGSRMFNWGRGGFQPFGRGGDNDERFESSRFLMGSGSNHHFTARVLFSLLRLAFTVAVIGALVLGVVAFFRTGGWRPAAPARRTRR
jgi:hypothetical protein